MSENFTLSPENTYLLNNANVEKFMKKFKITSGIGKDKNEYALTIITDKALTGTGVFKVEQIKGKINKYLVYKYPQTGFEAKTLSSDEALSQLNLDHEKGEMSIGLDIETGKFYVDVIDKWMHTAVFGITNSGKTVTLKWLLYQIAKYKYSEFILLGKDDFLALEDVKKVKYISDVATMNKAEFNAFIAYIWLNVADRGNKLKKLGYAGKYEEYKYNVMLKDPNAEQIPHLVIVMDEFETLRESVSAELAGGTAEFDTKLKTIANYVRSFGILLYFGSQNYLKEAIGIMRDYTGNQLIGYSKNVQAGFIDTDKTNLTNAIQKTFLFYSVQKDAFLKIPFDVPIEIDQKIRDASKENLLFKDNPDYYKRFNHTYELVNDLIFNVDSDIFKIIKNIYKYFKLEGYYEKLLKTAEFIPFSILLYSIFFNLEPENNIGPNVDIYPKSTFKQKIDQQLFDENKTFYEKTSLITSIKNIYKEGAQDKDAFIDGINEALSSYIKTITGNTDLAYLFPEVGNNNSDKIEKNEDNGENVGSVLEQIKKNEEEDKKKEDEKDLLIRTIHTGEIKPASFNGMYFVKKGTSDFGISHEAKKYKENIKTKLLNKMIAKQIKQTTGPVILDIEFTLGLQAKKDGMLSKVGRNDLDNLLKATIDGISGTIIKDDNQVFGIRTKINYIEKQSSIHKNNKVEIKVFDFNKDTILKYKSKFINETEVTELITIKIDKKSKVIIPSVNSMYFVNDKGKKQISSSALNYKYFLKEQIAGNKDKIKSKELVIDDVLLFLEFGLPKNSLIERDLDNLLKATIDSLSKTIIQDDDQIREIVCFKSLLSDEMNYKGSIKLKLWKYNIGKDLSVDEGSELNIDKLSQIFTATNGIVGSNQAQALEPTDIMDEEIKIDDLEDEPEIDNEIQEKDIIQERNISPEINTSKENIIEMDDIEIDDIKLDKQEEFINENDIDSINDNIDDILIEENNIEPIVEADLIEDLDIDNVLKQANDDIKDISENKINGESKTKEENTNENDEDIFLNANNIEEPEDINQETIEIDSKTDILSKENKKKDIDNIENKKELKMEDIDNIIDDDDDDDDLIMNLDDEEDDLISNVYKEKEIDIIDDDDMFDFIKK